ncbi:fused MFS/spermidine synthase [Candidatus Microgenomates bacterium]|nr:fused MFS/spermidine synthase [Candidatus Microgenomates bacterium]
MKFFSFFFPKIIHKETSLINGEIEVVEQFGQRSIRVENLEQSGPMVEKIWEKALSTINNEQSTINNILILGLGGGSVVKIINKKYPETQILGIDIDSAIVELGKKYFSLSEYKNLEIKIADAFKWMQKSGSSNYQTKYDLILVDLYLGRKIPKKMMTEEFLKKIKSLLFKNGLVIFNFLRTKEKKLEFQEFLKKLKKVYGDIKIIKPVVNYLLICR